MQLIAITHECNSAIFQLRNHFRICSVSYVILLWFICTWTLNVVELRKVLGVGRHAPSKPYALNRRGKRQRISTSLEAEFDADLCPPESDDEKKIDKQSSSSNVVASDLEPQPEGFASDVSTGPGSQGSSGAQVVVESSGHSSSSSSKTSPSPSGNSTTSNVSSRDSSDVQGNLELLLIFGFFKFDKTKHIIEICFIELKLGGKMTTKKKVTSVSRRRRNSGTMI